LSCPFFMPTQPSDKATFLHPSRLPLGGPWAGTCCAPGHQHAHPTSDELKDCNLGYALSCTRLPVERASDAVRFSMARENGTQLFLRFVCEKNYRPAGDGLLEYDSQRASWVSSHSDPQIQKMAECYLQSYLSRRSPSFSNFTSSTNHE
jgi:hypothetical protein